MADMAIEEKLMDAQVEGPREKLRLILEKNGEAVLQDSDRVEGLLRDHCGSYRKEISALVGALNERIPLELKGSWQTAMTPEAMRARLVQRMEDHRGLAPEVAEWAVDTWSYALGIGLGRRSDRLQSEILGNGSQFNRNGAAAGVANQADFAGNYGGVPSSIPSLSRSELERQAAVASDRPGGAAALAGAGFLATPAQKKKAGVGAGVVVLLAIAAAFGLNMHKPTQVAVVTPDPAPAPAPAPKPAPSIPPPAPVEPAAPTQLAVGTPVQVRMNQGINSDEVKIGETFTATLATPLVLNGKTLVPVGSDATLRVVRVDKGGKFTGQTQMELALVSLQSNGKNYPVSTADYSVLGPKQGVNAAKNTGIGAAIGAGVGFIGGKLLHHGKAGTLAGAGAGGGVGAVASKPQPAKVKPEQVISFHLNHPLPA